MRHEATKRHTILLNAERKSLSKLERKVRRMLAQCYSRKSICKKLGLSMDDIHCLVDLEESGT